MIDERKYLRMREAGASALEICRAVETDGFNQIHQIRIIRELFGFSLVHAKEVMIRARTGQSLEDYQEALVQALDAALSELPDGATDE